MKAAPTLLALLLLPVIPVSAQDAGGTYVNIGEYTDDAFTTVPAQPMAAPMPMAAPAPVMVPLETYEIVTEPIIVTADPYATQPVYGEIQYDPAPLETLPYQAAPGVIAPSFTAPAVASMGFADAEYEAARLAAYDANRDGTVTTAEAIATLRPLRGQ